MDRRKKILIINPGEILPTVMGSQERVKNYIIGLSNSHTIDFCFISKNKEALNLTEEKLSIYCNKVYPIQSINDTLFKRIFSFICFSLRNIIFADSKRYFYWGNNRIIRQLEKIIAFENYDIIQIEHPYMGELLYRIPNKVIKVLSLHDVYHSKKEKELLNIDKGKLSWLHRRELINYSAKLHRYSELADLLVTISQTDFDYYHKIMPLKRIEMIPMGINLPRFLDPVASEDKKAILFYGNLSSPQNKVALTRLITRIYPAVFQRDKSIKLLVVGASPPKDLFSYHDGVNIIFTGFQSEISEYFNKCFVSVIPLELGSGFRGRVVEIMGFGVPVIGTHNALDCIKMIHGQHGFIYDDDTDLIDSILLLKNSHNLRDSMAMNCRKFVESTYSFNSTYGTLSKIYENL